MSINKVCECKDVKALIKEGSDINIIYRYDRTALHYACKEGCIEIVDLLTS